MPTVEDKFYPIALPILEHVANEEPCDLLATTLAQRLQLDSVAVRTELERMVAEGYIVELATQSACVVEEVLAQDFDDPNESDEVAE